MPGRIARGIAALGLLCAAPVLADVPAPLAVEDSDVATLAAPLAHTVFVSSSWQKPGTRIIDGDSGKMLGQVQQSSLADFAVDPLGRYFYVAESIWTKGNRGTRQDMLTVYDAKSLKLVREIALPGRILVGGRVHNLSVSPDGKLAYVYDFDPASSVVVVDLVRGKTLRAIETPGCGTAAALPGAKFLSFCANGAIAVTQAQGGKAPVTQSAPFFSGEEDPVFDSSPVDPASGAATFLTYSGLVYAMTPGTSLNPPTGWSIQRAAGLPKPTSAPVLVNWFPTGQQPLAVNAATGRIFVLMHMGEYWSHKDPGTEVWVLDLATHKLIARRKLKEEALALQVSTDAQPLVFLSSRNNKLTILDAASFEEKHVLDDVASGVMTTVASAK